MPAASVRLDSEPRSVGEARRFLRVSLESWGLDDLEFAASQGLTELATNAVLHARTAFEVVVEWDGDETLRVCVRDFSPKLPVQRSYALDATTGRGLGLVERLCKSWGIEREQDGKVVWFEVTGDSDEETGVPDLDSFLDLEDLDGLDEAPDGSSAVDQRHAARDLAA